METMIKYNKGTDTRDTISVLGKHFYILRYHVKVVFGVASAPEGPQVRMGGERRPGTTGTGPYRRFGTGMCVYARNRFSRR